MPILGFWNIDKNVNAASVAAFAREFDVDILVLAENDHRDADLLRHLNAKSDRLYFPDPGLSNRLTILTRFRSRPTCLIRDSPGIAIRHYELPLSDSLLVVATHLSSKLWKSPEEQILASTRVSRFIRDAEKQVGHCRTIVIGDLNMNPFEIGVVGSEGLHAIMDRRIASTICRTVQGEECQFFYNPMWNYFGDRNLTPPGTYFYNSGGEVNYYWNIFDQVLIRPALLDLLGDHSIEIVTKLQDSSLLNSTGCPDRKEMSDHLPVVCRLDEILEPADVEY